MAQQTINIGANPNDNTGDPLRVAGGKINANFTEVYTTSQAGFNQANTGTTLAQAAFNFANTIVSDTQIDPYARATANAGFDQANTATDTAQAGFDQANTATDTAQAGFDQANTANTLAQAAFDQANTAGGTSLPLANGISNIDIALENGPITLTANVFIMTIDDTNGSIDLPGNVTNFEACSAINFVPNSSGDGLGYSTIHLVPDTNATQDQYIIIDPTAPGHIHVRAGGQQDGSSADLFLGGEFTNFRIPAGSNTNAVITANGQSWIFGSDSALTFPDSTIQTTAANQGFRNTLLIDTVAYNAANNEEILLCDPNAAGANIAVNLSANVNDGKIFTIKNINPGGYTVNVGATTIEDPVSKSIVSEVVMANTGEVYTWVAYSGVYRHIG